MEIARYARHRVCRTATWMPGHLHVEMPFVRWLIYFLKFTNHPLYFRTFDSFYNFHNDVPRDLHVEIGISPNSNLHVEIDGGNRMP